MKKYVLRPLDLRICGRKRSSTSDMVQEIIQDSLFGGKEGAGDQGPQGQTPGKK